MPKTNIGLALREHISGVVRDVMLLATDNVTNATPVDTGHAASNWILSFGHPYTSVVGARDAVDWSVHDQGIAAMADYDVGRDGVVYLRNNVSYLKFLDAGSSQQAPANFVAISLMGGMRRAPRGTKERVRKMLVKLARNAYAKGQRP